MTSADAAAGTFTVVGGPIGRIASSNTIEADGDLFTLESVASAVAAGRPIRSEGRRSSPDNAGIRSVLRVRFEDDR